MNLAGYGTGFFVQKDGWILTCLHVVREADHINVLISTGETLSAAIVEQDPEHDLALLWIRGHAPAVVPISFNENIALGDEIYTLGFPVLLARLQSETNVGNCKRRHRPDGQS